MRGESLFLGRGNNVLVFGIFGLAAQVALPGQANWGQLDGANH